MEKQKKFDESEKEDGEESEREVDGQLVIEVSKGELEVVRALQELW